MTPEKIYLPIGNKKDILIEPRETLSDEALLAILRQCGLKVTNQRLSILKVLNTGSRVHMTAQDILDEVKWVVTGQKEQDGRYSGHLMSLYCNKIVSLLYHSLEMAHCTREVLKCREAL